MGTRQDAANVEISYGETSVNIVAKENIAAKTKLYNFIGEVGTAEYVWKWGVIDHSPTEECPKGSPYDVLQIEPELVFQTCLEIGKAENDPLSEEKLDLLQEIGMLMDVFEIEKSGEIPNDLLLAVKVLFMDAEEFGIYKTEMINSGYILDEDEENDEDDDADDLDTAEETNDTKTSNITETTEKGEKNEKDTKEESAELEELPEEDDMEDMQILPEITNEASVFEALISIANAKLECVAGVDASGINWEKAGILRKPSLIATYLKEIEREIINNFLSSCKKQAEKVSDNTKQKSETGKKRKASKEATEAPKNKKKKINK